MSALRWQEIALRALEYADRLGGLTPATVIWFDVAKAAVAIRDSYLNEGSTQQAPMPFIGARR